MIVRLLETTIPDVVTMAKQKRSRRGQGSIFQRPGRSGFYLRYTVNGSTRTRKLEGTTKEKASAEAAELMRPAAAKTRAEAAVHIAESKKLVTSCKVPVTTAAAAYCETEKRAQKTLDFYTSIWNQFAEWVATTHPAISEVGQIDRELALQYAGQLHGRKISSRTFNAHRNALSKITRKLLMQSGADMVDPWQYIEKLDQHTESRMELTTTQVQALRKTLIAESDLIAARVGKSKAELKTMPYPADHVKLATDRAISLDDRRRVIEQWRVVMDLGIFAGLRLGDAVTLTWDAVDLEACRLSLVPLKTKRKGKRVNLPLHPELTTALKRARRWSSGNDMHVCPDLAARYAYNAAGVAKDAGKVFTAAGMKNSRTISGRDMPAASYGFHSLRHTFVSICANAGVPLATVQALVGHGSPAMTRHYTHVDMDAAARHVEALQMAHQPHDQADDTITRQVGVLRDSEKLDRIREIIAEKKRPTSVERAILAVLDG